MKKITVTIIFMSFAIFSNKHVAQNNTKKLPLQGSFRGLDEKGQNIKMEFIHDTLNIYSYQENGKYKANGKEYLGMSYVLQADEINGKEASGKYYYIGKIDFFKELLRGSFLINEKELIMMFKNLKDEEVINKYTIRLNNK
jgi:hypothetical protein